MTKKLFFRRVATLLSGTVLAQALPLLFAPLLTRVYSPSDFGVLGVYIAVTSIVGVVATFRYELAIVQSRTVLGTVKLTNLSLMVSFLVSILCLILIAFFEDLILSTSASTLGAWLYLAPLSIFAIGAFQSFLYYNNKNANFSLIARSKVFQSVVNISFSLTFALHYDSPFGLLLGHVLGQIVLGVLLSQTWVKPAFGFSDRYSLKRYAVMAKSFRRFPFISAPGALLDSSSVQAPVLFINSAYNTQYAGYYNFIFRIMGAPFALISSAISQVFLQKIATEKGVAISQIKMLLKLLFVPSLAFILVINIFGVEIFEFAFGEEWAEAGNLAGTIVFSIVARFTVSPLSMVMALKENVKLGFFWQLSYFIAIITLLILMRNSSFESFLLMFVIIDVSMYLIYLALIIFAAKRV